VIEKAKKYAKRHGTSLSRMIEEYFESLTSKHDQSTEIKITPLVESLSGVVHLSIDVDFKNSRSAYLHQKHL